MGNGARKPVLHLNARAHAEECKSALRWNDEEVKGLRRLVGICWSSATRERCSSMHKRRIDTFLLTCVLLVLSTRSICAADNSLLVGAAKVDATKWASLPPVTPKYDHQIVYVRAIVIDNGATRAALISIPGSNFDWPAISKAVTSELNCPSSQIVISATHAHSYSAKPVSALTDSVMEAVRQAKGKLQPARIGFGTGRSYLNVNRDAFNETTGKWGQSGNLDAASDKTVAVVKFETPSHELIAAYVNYAMHPINAYTLGITTGDFPEAMSRYIEKAFGDAPIVAFALGAAGDQNPLYLRSSTNAMASRAGNKITGFELDRETSEGPLRVTDSQGKPVVTRPADPKVVDALFRFIESEAQILGEEAIRVMTTTSETTTEASITGAEKVINCPGRKRTNGDKLDPNTREGIEGIYVDAPPVEMPVGVLRIGTVAVALVGDEPYSLIGEKVKRAAPLANTIVVSLANAKGNTGYIPDDASYGHLTFQVLNSTLKQGCAEKALVNTIRDLEQQTLGER